MLIKKRYSMRKNGAGELKSVKKRIGDEKKKREKRNASGSTEKRQRSER